MVRIPIPVAFIPQLVILAVMFLVPYGILWFLGNEFGRYDNDPRIFRLLVPTGNKIVLVFLLYLVLFLAFPSSLGIITGQKADPAPVLSTPPVTMSAIQLADTITITPRDEGWESVASVNITVQASSGATTRSEVFHPKSGEAIILDHAATSGRDHVLCMVNYENGVKKVVLDTYV